MPVGKAALHHGRSAAGGVVVSEEGPGEGAAKLVGVVDGQDGGGGVLVEPRPGGVGGGEEVDLAAERGAN